MSLKPPKKSDKDKSWMGPRRDIKRSIHPEYHLIVTEGIETEPNYLNGLKHHINRVFRERIHLEICGSGCNTTGVFDLAKKLAENNPNGYKHVWVVYDTDDFPAEKINSVPALCKNQSTSECQYHAIWSNQCIELWFLLHFSYMHSNLHRYEYYEKLDTYFESMSFGKYSKNRQDIFNVLMPYIDRAIDHAKKLETYNKGKTPSDAAPGTKMYELIEKLKPYIL